MLKRILAADDSKTMRQAIQYTFEKERAVELVTVENGQGVLEALRREPFDLLVLDYKMPDIDGLSLCKRLKQDPMLSKIWVLLLVGQRFQEQEGIPFGPDGFIRKPFLSSDLIEKVAEFLQFSYSPAPPPYQGVSENEPAQVSEGESFEIDVDFEDPEPISNNPPMPSHMGGLAAPSFPSQDIEPAVSYSPVPSHSPLPRSHPTGNALSPPPLSETLGSVPPSSSGGFDSGHFGGGQTLTPPPLPSQATGQPHHQPMGQSNQFGGATLTPPPLPPQSGMLIDDLPEDSGGPSSQSVVYSNPLETGGASSGGYISPPPGQQDLSFSSPQRSPQNAPPLGVGQTSNPYGGQDSYQTSSPFSPPPPFSPSPRAVTPPTQDPPIDLHSSPLSEQNGASPHSPLSRQASHSYEVPVEKNDSMDVLIGTTMEQKDPAELELPMEEAPQKQGFSGPYDQGEPEGHFRSGGFVSPQPARSPLSRGIQAPPISPHSPLSQGMQSPHSPLSQGMQSPHSPLSQGVQSPLPSSSNPVFDPMQRSTPRIDHLDETAVLPRIRKHKELDASPPPLSSPTPPTPTNISTAAREDLESNAPQMVCPDQHCQLIVDAWLSLRPLSHVLQFAEMLQSLLRKKLSLSEEDRLFISYVILEGRVVFTLGGNSLLLRAFVPGFLECFGPSLEEARLEISESLLDPLPMEIQGRVQRLSLQSRITLRPFALTLRHIHSELRKASLEEVVHAIEQPQETLYERAEQGEHSDLEEPNISKKIRLRNIILDNISIPDLRRLMEESYSIKLEEIMPLNFTDPYLCLAVILHFEQRYQLSEFAEAIQEQGFNIDSTPFDEYG